MRKILGLDLGINTVGWAVVNEEYEKLYGLEGAGCRVIPMDISVLKDFRKGYSESPAVERILLRNARRMHERHLLRRERLNRILHMLGFLPEHYTRDIDLDTHYGQFLPGRAPKIAWCETAPRKFKFLFERSFQGMLSDFVANQPQYIIEGRKAPYDWTIYYLRKKALTEQVEKEELAWIILNFNQKRGYYERRGEEVNETDKLVEFHTLRVVDVKASDEKKGRESYYDILLENGWTYRQSSRFGLDWLGKVKDFMVTTDVEADGRPKLDKKGNIRRSFRVAEAADSIVQEKRMQQALEHSRQTVGTYIYDSLLKNPAQKIKGTLVRRVERKYYKAELKAILDKQKEFYPELRSRELYMACVNELYPCNDTHRASLVNRDFSDLFLEDIIFYQRPCKNKRTPASDCPYEEWKYVDRNTGEVKSSPVKCVAESHPLFQEFRLWQFINGIRIYRKEKKVNGKLVCDAEVTVEFLKDEADYAALFDWLNNQEKIDQQTFFAYPVFGLTDDIGEYRWNYVEDKWYPCNRTRALLLDSLQKAGISAGFLSKETEEALWHLLYSVVDKQEFMKALDSFRKKQNLDEKFTAVFRNFPLFRKEYGLYSAKAIKKLLPLMRRGKYWREEDIDNAARERIGMLRGGECEGKISLLIKKEILRFLETSGCRALPVRLACYVVYGWYADGGQCARWNQPEDIDHYLKVFRRHSRHHPVVGKLITETLLTVRDIWKQTGRPDEIHLELGREIKNPGEMRGRLSAQMLKQQEIDLRIEILLQEFQNPEFGIENVRPHSPGQQKILRVYEDEVLGRGVIPEDIRMILRKFKRAGKGHGPVTAEILRYKNWLDRKCRSPYTGEPIPLDRLFTSDYELEHIIPQSRYFDDSQNNKVICETNVNRLKGNQLGYEFIRNHSGERVVTAFGNPVGILTVEAYEQFVREYHSQSGDKMKNLLLEDISDGFNRKPLSDSRYFSSMVKTLLANVVQDKDEDNAPSGNVRICPGVVTNRLRCDWGMDKMWNDMVFIRFHRMNRFTGTNDFGYWEKDEGGMERFHIRMPLEYRKGFSPARIDYRHHALDAIVIACATRDHIRFLTNDFAASSAKEVYNDMKKRLRRIEVIESERLIDGEKIEVAKEFYIPWPTFGDDVRAVMDDVIVSFKRNTHIMGKTTNRCESFRNENGQWQPFIVRREGKGRDVRLPLHGDTVYGRVNLRKVKEVSLATAITTPDRIVGKKLKAAVQRLLSEGKKKKEIADYFRDKDNGQQGLDFSKIGVYYFTDETSGALVAVRRKLNLSFNEEKIRKNVTDTAIQKILLRHLENNGGNSREAFSEKGVEEMNRMICILNDGKPHQPIRSVRVSEALGNKFCVGEVGNKVARYVRPAEETGLFFAVYTDENGKRSYETFFLHTVVERQKQGLALIPETDGDHKLLFWLVPGDLVYIPTPDNVENIRSALNRKYIYKMVACSGKEGRFIPAMISDTIFPDVELGKNNCDRYSWAMDTIKDVCVPIKVDRLGRVVEIFPVE